MDSWFGMDKLKHVVISMTIYLMLAGFLTITHASTILFVTSSAAAMVTFMIGLGKELVDEITGMGTPSHKDMIANMVGIFLGIVLHIWIIS